MRLPARAIWRGQVRVPPDVIDVDREADARRRARSQRSLAWASVFTQARSAAYIGCSGSIASGTPAARACGSSAAIPSRTCRCAPARSFEPFGRPPAISTRRARADGGGLVDGAAVVVERGAAAGFVGGGKQAGAAIAASRSGPRARIRLPAFSTPAACTMSRHGAIAVMPARDAALDELSKRPRLHRRGVDREQRAVVGQIAHQLATPRVAMTSRMRCAASSGSASSPAASARRNSSARCTVERVLSWPPIMVK